MVGPGSSSLPLQAEQRATVPGQGCPLLSQNWQVMGVPEQRAQCHQQHSPSMAAAGAALELVLSQALTTADRLFLGCPQSSASQGTRRGSCGTAKGDAPHAKEQSSWGPPETWWTGGLRPSWLVVVEKILLSLVVHGSKETMAKQCETCFPLQAELARYACVPKAVLLVPHKGDALKTEDKWNCMARAVE